mmetsp:Transcript_28007/g.45063  ORF Transcript_28007/g.45063 Transcript_28007/m.45063 type:complete len:108 (+) Transcript_28007:68-391(+)
MAANQQTNDSLDDLAEVTAPCSPKRKKSYSDETDSLFVISDDRQQSFLKPLLFFSKQGRESAPKQQRRNSKIDMAIVDPITKSNAHLLQGGDSTDVTRTNSFRQGKS